MHLHFCEYKRNTRAGHEYKWGTFVRTSTAGQREMMGDLEFQKSHNIPGRLELTGLRAVFIREACVLTILGCVCVFPPRMCGGWAHTCHCVHVEVREQPCGRWSLFVFFPPSREF